MTKSIHLQGTIAHANMTEEWKMSMKLFMLLPHKFHTNFTVIVFGKCAIEVKSIGKQTSRTGRSGNIVHILYLLQFLKGKQNKKFTPPGCNALCFIIEHE